MPTGLRLAKAANLTIHPPIVTHARWCVQKHGSRLLVGFAGAL